MFPLVDIAPVAFVVFPVVICAAKLKLEPGHKPCDVLYQRNGSLPVPIISLLFVPVITGIVAFVWRYIMLGKLNVR